MNFSGTTKEIQVSDASIDLITNTEKEQHLQLRPYEALLLKLNKNN